MDGYFQRPKMRLKKFIKSAPAIRRAWESPALTELAIGRETKSVQEDGRSLGMATSGVRQLAPQPPASPATKLGFSFEMAFPLSARIEH
jgi:hypothetical protein